MKKLCVFVLCFVLCVLALSACGRKAPKDVLIATLSDGVFEYAIMNRADGLGTYAKVIGYEGEEEANGLLTDDAVMPETINFDGVEYDVTTVESFAFRFKRVTAVTVGARVTRIADSAFKECFATRITVSSSVVSIGAYAFADCKTLRTVNMETLNPPTLGANAFKVYNGKKYELSPILTVRVKRGVETKYYEAWKEYKDIIIS